ncbi:plastocyanin [Synechococcus sp. PCC 6312]|uniref:plastocyanin n=1 Tax=Synechococcus sp. (strain ATCC 27167 / PCC 6312) TaxID=195253 RepID=UPI00029F2131|nr:plastocyanin [Synechococcus sp. PCC 6312]AFY59382.1 plastocyanin [Synechococcus sp. PCC 6312]
MNSKLSRPFIHILSLVLVIITCIGAWLGPVTVASAETYTIRMGSDSGNLAFEPATLTVKPGDVVQWQNNKLPPHNVIFDGSKVPADTIDLVGELSHSKLMVKANETYELEITDALPPGEYAYFCAPHRGAGMVGKLIITG